MTDPWELACGCAGRKPSYVLFNNMKMTADAKRFLKQCSEDCWL